MAGNGPRPKDPSRRARTNKDPIPGRTVEVDGLAPEGLPLDLLPDGEEWHTATVRWWTRWCESPLAENLPAVDWSELEACAVLHHEFMHKRTFNLGSELRLRMAKFGATPEDRAKLRITIADAEAKDGHVSTGTSARARRGTLHALPPVVGQ